MLRQIIKFTQANISLTINRQSVFIIFKLKSYRSNFVLDTIQSKSTEQSTISVTWVHSLTSTTKKAPPVSYQLFQHTVTITLSEFCIYERQHCTSSHSIHIVHARSKENCTMPRSFMRRLKTCELIRRSASRLHQSVVFQYINKPNGMNIAALKTPYFHTTYWQRSDTAQRCNRRNKTQSNYPTLYRAK